MSIEITPVEGLPEVGEGDDLAALLSEPLRALGIRDGDVVAVTQKIVSKAEGRVVPAEGDDRTTWVERETRRVVARRGDLMITETAHGFICANAGVDASNVRTGFVSLLPEDPDGSAEAIRRSLLAHLGLQDLGIVVTDTFGRPWRSGLVNVAIGCAGLPPLVDLRGRPDHLGRSLEVTVVALADEVAAASGLVMGKAARVPAALVRGIDIGVAPPGAARSLVRPENEDLFRSSPLESIQSRRAARSFGPGYVPRDALVEAIRAAEALTGPEPPWTFIAVESASARRRLLGTLAEIRRDDHDAVVGGAPVMVVPWVRLGKVEARDPAEPAIDRDAFLLSAGAAVDTLQLALHAQGLASSWSTSNLRNQPEMRAALGVDNAWFTPGVVAVGPAPPDEMSTYEPPVDVDARLDAR